MKRGKWLRVEDASDLVAALNDDALREALTAADWDPEPDLPVYP